MGISYQLHCLASRQSFFICQYDGLLGYEFKYSWRFEIIKGDVMDTTRKWAGIVFGDVRGFLQSLYCKWRPLLLEDTYIMGENAYNE